MITDIAKVWEAAASVAFDGAKCAAGSLPIWEGGEKRAVKTPNRAGKRARSFSRPEGRDDVFWEARHGRKVII